MSGNVVTKLYRPPEIFYGKKNYDEKIDIWSLGVSITEMMVEWEPNAKEFD